MASPRLILGHHGVLHWRRLVLSGEAVHQHTHVIGLTGQGKSKNLASRFAQLVTQGIPAALVDPHADLADDALRLLADAGLFAHEGGYERVLYVDFARRDRFLPFNVLRQPYDDHSVARNLVEVCKRVWPSLAAGAAPMFENVMLAASLTLIQNGLPLTELPRLVTDQGYRHRLLARVTDPQIVHFFRASFDHLRPVDQLDQAQSSLRRMFLLTFSPTLRYSLGQTGNALDFRALMDRKVSAIYNLGGLDEETQRFLGALITVGYEVAAYSRALAGAPRNPYHLLLDEFPMFTAQSEDALNNVLSRTRKYGLFLLLANQTFSQLSGRLRGALQNTTKIAFRLGRDDAVWMAPRFASFDPSAVKHAVADDHAAARSHPLFVSIPETFERMAGQLEQLAPRQAIVRVGHGVTTIRTLAVPPPATSPQRLESIKERFAARLMTPAHLVVAGVDAIPEPGVVPGPPPHQWDVER